MKNKIYHFAYKNNALITKVLMFLFSLFLILYTLPEGRNFQYEYKVGDRWHYEDLYAPIRFFVKKSLKSQQDLKKEIQENKTPYFTKHLDIEKKAIKHISIILGQSDYSKIATLVDSIYKIGVYNPNEETKAYKLDAYMMLIVDSVAHQSFIDQLMPLEEAKKKLEKRGVQKQLSYENIEQIKKMIEPNVFYDSNLTHRNYEQEISHIQNYDQPIEKGQKIIDQGDIVTEKIGNTLDSLREAYIKVERPIHITRVTFLGYVLLYGLLMGLLAIYLYYFYIHVFDNNRYVWFLLICITLTHIFSFSVIGNFNNVHLYLIPYGILPLTVRAFFNAHISAFIHIITIIGIGFFVSDGFEFVFIQITAGIYVLLSGSSIYKRFSFVMSIFRLAMVYLIAYIGFTLIRYDFTSQPDYTIIYFLIISSMLTFLSYVFIYAFERLFGMVSDLSLLELSDTNSPALRLLSQRAPGTMQHSIQVANLAEEAAKNIKANVLLTRVGALYHDLGKAKNPMFFSENQQNISNPHDDLTPKQSAQIILQHVTEGIALAKKYNIPDRIIDFIRTHHGDSLMYYFFSKYKEQQEGLEINEKDFRYPGPLPFSKETAIVMMCDAIEAATKSLKNPSQLDLKNSVDKVIDHQINSGQFKNADITFKEINKVRQILKKKLLTIYHPRIVYPE